MTQHFLAWATSSLEAGMDLTILVYILDTKRCYASVIIPRMEIGRAEKYYCYFLFNDGAKIISIKVVKNKDCFINTICKTAIARLLVLVEKALLQCLSLLLRHVVSGVLCNTCMLPRVECGGSLVPQRLFFSKLRLSAPFLFLP